jgi:hypothetical protein
MADQPRSDGVAHLPSWREPPAPTGVRATSAETSTKGRRFVGTTAGVEKVSSKDCVAASSLIRWGGTAALVGGLSTPFVGGILPPPTHSPNDGE